MNKVFENYCYGSYMSYKYDNISDEDIAKEWNVSVEQLNEAKEIWGVSG